MSQFSFVRLEDCCEIVSGATPSTSVKSYWGGGIAWATPKDLSGLDSKYIEETPQTLTEDGYKNCSAKMLPIGSVLFSSRAPIGHVAINRVPMCTNQGFKSFVPDPERMSADYLYYWLKSNKPYLQSLGNGATFKELSKAIVAEIKVPLPPLLEQFRIAAILDKADALRAKRREAIAKLDQLLQSVFLDMFGDPIENPKGWKKSKLDEIINFTGGSQPPKTVFSDVQKTGYVRLVQIRDFRTDKYMTYIPESMARRRFSKEDVMIGRYGPPVFQIFRGLEGSYNVALMKAEPKKNLDSEYLFHLLKNDRIQEKVIANSERSAGQSGVNLDFLHEIEVGLPPLDLQERFASIANVIADQKVLFVSSDLHADRLFGSLQQRAFAGTL